MEDHHRYRDNLDRIEQVLLLIHSVHVPWVHKMMQKRNEKKKEVGLRPQRKLEDFECSSHGRHIRQSDMPKCHHLPKEKRKKKKGKRGNLYKFSERTLGVSVVVLYMDQKGTKRKRSGERSYPDSNRGNQKFFDISSL